MALKNFIECHGVVFVLMVVFIVLGTSIPSVAAEMDKVQAKAHYETANRYYEVQEYDRALEGYKAAYIAKPDPAFLFNIGQCYRKMGNDEKAQEYFKQFLKKAEPNDPNRAMVEARLRDTEVNQESKNDLQKESKRIFLEPVVSTSTQPISPTIMAKSSISIKPQKENLFMQRTTPPEPTSAPVYKTWWFWTGAGAVVVGGVVTGVLLSSGSGTNIPNTALGSQGAF